MPVPANQPPTQRRPGWPQVLAWYFAGMFATGTAWAVIVAVAKATSATVATMVGQGMVVAAIVMLVRRGGSMPRRSRVALVLGAVTPFIVVAMLIAYVIWAFAHSDWQF